MKSATVGLNSKVLGSLQGVAAFALMAAVAMSGVAGAQDITLSADVDAPDNFAAGEEVEVTLTITRTDANANDDSDVTAIGGELALPAGWKLSLDADNDCDPVLQDGETTIDNQAAGVNAQVQFKRDQALFVDPPDNTECTPVPPTGDTLEFFWLDAQVNDPLPVSFPIVLNLVLVAAASGTGSSGDQDIDLTVKYRVTTGEEVTPAPTGSDTTSGADGCALPGDADLSGGVDPADAQASFLSFLGLATVDVDCANICDPDTSGVDPADAQGIFLQFLGLPNCTTP